MKKLQMLILLLLAVITAGFAQTSYSILNSTKKPDLNVQEVSADNVWIGAKLTGTIGADNFEDGILLNGKILYNANFGSFKLPIISNVNLDFSKLGSLEAFLVGDKGISVGVYPYKIIKDGSAKLVLHGGLAYKLLPKDKITITPQQTKIFAGLELAKKIKEDSYPFTISVTPAYLINNLENNNFLALEATTILPVSGGLGVLAEYTAPFDSSVKNIFKIGVILTGTLR